jgi:hydroxymethylpyrimidine pyrophosphatase-like HAD family hydrolase
VFVTGRPLRWAEDVFDHVGRHGFAIVSNGALVWDVAGSRIHLHRAIEPGTGLEVARRLRDAVPGTAYAVERSAGIAVETGFLERYPLPPGSLRGSLEEVFALPALKILARHEQLGPQEFWDTARDLLEMSAHGVTKASTLELFCAERGITAAEVIAFGDMPNDLDMLAWAGTSYAMANAHPSVRAVADHLAGTNDEDGVAEVIELLLDSPREPRAR